MHCVRNVMVAPGGAMPYILDHILNMLPSCQSGQDSPVHVSCAPFRLYADINQTARILARQPWSTDRFKMIIRN